MQHRPTSTPIEMPRVMFARGKHGSIHKRKEGGYVLGAFRLQGMRHDMDEGIAVKRYLTTAETIM